MSNLLRAGCLAAALLLGCGDTDTVPEEQTKTTEQSAVVLTTDSTGLVQTQTARGVQVQLDGRFQSAVIVRRNSDGSLTTECHDEHADAEAFMAGTPRTSNLEVK